MKQFILELGKDFLFMEEEYRLQVEYALSRSMSPTMVAEYQRLLIPKEVLQAQIEEYAQIALDSHDAIVPDIKKRDAELSSQISLLYQKNHDPDTPRT